MLWATEHGARRRREGVAGAGRIHYRSTRTHRGAPPAEFAGRYGPTGGVFHAAPGTLEYFLTERYCLYAAERDGGGWGRTWRGDIAHAPWPLQPAAAEVERLRMTQQIGVELPGDLPLLHYADRLDVVAWMPERID